MTTPRYPSGCAAGSQAHGLAASPSDYAWGVNFNNGNSDWNHQDNTGFVRAVRSVAVPVGEYQGATLRDLFHAWKRARRKKVPSNNQAAFEAHWIDGLLDLQHAINARTWTPRPLTCFIAQRPKARQIHAADFADRVAHHWIVPQLEALFERGFIHDSYANRRGKGTHAAVARLRTFVRQVQCGHAGGWYLQLDIRNFFNSIHRPTLYALLKRRLLRESAPAIWLHLVHALLRHPAERQGVVHRATATERARVPAYKRLENAAPGCGIPIGNLPSQFFANVYLDQLDQFVKHELKARKYLRYVDDFVLVHPDRAQLEAWKVRIETFLRDRLRLELKPNAPLRPLRTGIDFLGYVVFPTHTRVRSRVVRHAFAAINEVRRDRSAAGNRRRRAALASYAGHFRHADASSLTNQLKRHAWLAEECG